MQVWPSLLNSKPETFSFPFAAISPILGLFFWGSGQGTFSFFYCVKSSFGISAAGVSAVLVGGGSTVGF